MTTTPEPTGPNAASSTSTGASKPKPGPRKADSDCPWKRQQPRHRHRGGASLGGCTQRAEHGNSCVQAGGGRPEVRATGGLLDESFDEMSGEFDFSSQGVVFTKQTRRSWAMDCYSDEFAGHSR